MVARVSRESLDRAHGLNVERLVDAFGEAHRAVVESVYSDIRTQFEATAKIPDYLPILIGRGAYDALVTHLGKRPVFKSGILS